MNRPVHQLVAEAYIPKPDWWTPGMKLDVGHKNIPKRIQTRSFTCAIFLDIY